MSVLLSISVAAFMGLMMTRLVKPLKLPAVTAYLVAGILVGPYFLGRLGIPGLGFITHADVERLELISNVALGFIAFAIGNEFRLSQLKQIGRRATVIGAVQALTAVLFVHVALLALHVALPGKLSVPQVITLGAIAAATAPAATLMVVRQYKAKGPLTDLLLPIVALDDAVGLVVFAVFIGIAKAMVQGSVDLVSTMFNPLLEIILSLFLGAFMGWTLTRLERIFNSNTNRLSLTIVFVFLTVALSMLKFKVGIVSVSFSSLLVCMMMGTVFCNLCPLSSDLMERADRWTAPLFALFFVISGAALELRVFSDAAILVVGVVYILSRSLGKYFGAYVSARWTGCSSKIQKHLGVTLLPQAGVALGMCVTASELGEAGNLIRNIILFSVMVYELVGPLLTKLALTAAGDIQPKGEEVLQRRSIKLQNADAK